MDSDDCLLYVQQCGLAQAMCRQQDQMHYHPVWKPQRLTEQFISFPWSGQARRPRFSDEKIHACDSPGCGKSFYERCTLLRHQRLKHGRKAKFSRFVKPVCRNSVPASQNGALPPLYSTTVAPSHDDALPLSYSDALAPSRKDDLPPSRNDTLPLSQSDTLPLS